MKKQFLKTAFSTLIISALCGGGVNAQVGIGTTSPSNDLDVEGSGAAATAIDINNTSTGDPKINFQLGGSSPTFSMGIDNSDADKFKIGTSALETNTRFTIDASGNCGIGTSSPNAPLQFANTTASRKIVLYEAANNDHEFSGFGINSSVLRYQLGASPNSHVFYAATSSTTSNELMRITSDGFVGIGTASPTTNLHVAGTFRLVDGNQSDGKVLTSNANGVATWQTASSSLPAGTSGQTLRHNGTTWIANSTIFNNGTNVGIGTASPTTNLHVAGTFRLVDGNQSNGKVLTSDADGVATWQTASGGSLPAGTSGQTLRHNGTTWVANSTIFNNGTNVGIGTATPDAKLTIGTPGVTFTDYGITSDSRIGVVNGSGNRGALYMQSVGTYGLLQAFNYGTNAYIPVVISPDGGNVGIGTASPSYKLHVSGTTSLDGTTVVNASGAATNFTVGANILVANGATGKIGIGTATPDAKLTIGTPGVTFTDYGITSDSRIGVVNGSGNRGAMYMQSVGTYGLLQAFNYGTSAYIPVVISPDGGNVGIGTTSPSEKLHVVGNICATGTIATCSDLRYKKDINKIDNALSLISKFNGYTYNFKVKEFPDHKFDSTAQVGFIAQELQEVLPQVVQKNESGYLSVDYAKVTPLLLMAIKEQQAEIAIQKSEIETLKAQASNSTQKLSDLENKMNAMLLLLNKKEEVTAKQ